MGSRLLRGLLGGADCGSGKDVGTGSGGPGRVEVWWEDEEAFGGYRGGSVDRGEWLGCIAVKGEV